jgi:hypothetical protein
VAADAHAATVVERRVGDRGSACRSSADEHHLAIGIGWAISRMPPCWILGTRSVEARLARLGVALGDVDALDDDADATGASRAEDAAAARARLAGG